MANCNISRFFFYLFNKVSEKFCLKATQKEKHTQKTHYI